jgi:hypothetical protein
VVARAAARRPGRAPRARARAPVGVLSDQAVRRSVARRTPRRPRPADSRVRREVESTGSPCEAMLSSGRRVRFPASPGTGSAIGRGAAPAGAAAGLAVGGRRFHRRAGQARRPRRPPVPGLPRLRSPHAIGGSRWVACALPISAP